MSSHNRRTAPRVGKPARIVGWSRVSDDCITNGTHNICRVVVNSVERYEVWLVTTRPHRLIGIYATADAAREAVG